MNLENSLEEKDKSKRHEEALRELKLILAAYEKTMAGSQESRLAARHLIEHLIFQLGIYKLEKEDWAPYLIKIQAAARETAEGYVGEIRAYNEAFQSLMEDRTQAEAEALLNQDAKSEKKHVDLSKADSFFNLRLMLEAGLLDNDYFVKKLIVGEIRNEVEDLMKGEQLDVFKQQTARRLVEDYEKLGVLDRVADADIFALVA